MEKVILGLTEEVTIVKDRKEKQVTARIDTGATASSIDSKLAKEFELKEIVERFKIVKSASGTKRRPIVKVMIKMNGLVIEAEFTLADRAHMTYPLLIGQNILKKGNFLIDPNKK